MKKAFDQTFRDLKREVNKKVLKVPSIEQKVLDSTSNEPWGPHGSLLAEIAQASRNSNEYQIIMSVIWKRINDTGKNWRHVYKALTVLEYLVAHGSERVIDEIREHAYQINTLSDFQYVDSSGRDQGSNVRKKSQCLVVLVGDKERIQEVRQKASANRDKFRSISMGSMYRPGSYSTTGGYGDRYEDRYGIRDDDLNGYGREREWRHRDEDIYHRDHYDGDYDDCNSNYGYGDTDYRGTGRSRRNDEYSSSRSSFDGERDIGQRSSRRGGCRAEDQPQNRSPGRQRFQRKYSEQNLAPLSYDEAVGAAQSPTHSARDVGTSPTSAPKSSSPRPNSSPSQDTGAPAPEPFAGSSQAPAPENKNVNGSGEFDPHASLSAAQDAPSTSAGPEMDLLASLFEPFSSNSLALVPAGSLNGTSQGNSTVITNSKVAFAASSSPSVVANQDFDDPFGDGPFKAIPYSNCILPAQPPESLPSSIRSPYVPQPASLNIQLNPIDQQEMSTSNQEIDILAGILPSSRLSPPVYSQSEHPIPPCMGFPQAIQLALQSQNGPTAQQGFPSQPDRATSMTSFAVQPGQQSLWISFPAQIGLADRSPQTGFTAQSAPLTGFPSQIGSFPQVGFPASGQNLQPNAGFCRGHSTPFGSVRPFLPSLSTQVYTGAATRDTAPNFFSHHGTAAQGPLEMALQSSKSQSVTVPFAMQTIPSSSASPLVTGTPPAKNKFEMKSTIWSDTLNRGLVNLNISGPKTNPLADIGVDFDAINRKEKRMETPSNATVTSTVTMGKAMGSGSGIGRAGAGALRPLQTQTLGPGAGIPMGGYGGLNQPMGMGMSIAMSRPMNLGMQQPTGFPPGPSIARGYYPLPGANNYGWLPFGGGYR